MRILVFGTYQADAHPRVTVLVAGLREQGMDVVECNVPLGLDTANRVAMLQRPWRAPMLAIRLLRCWLALVRRARGSGHPDVVIIPYLGHFDVHLARWRFRRSVVVLDHLAGASDTANDRGTQGGLKVWLLRALDNAALAAAHLILVDTEEQLTRVSHRYQPKAMVVPVGAADAWFRAVRPQASGRGDPMRIVFFGLYTPLQGTATIASALKQLSADVGVTMIGVGQERAQAEALVRDDPRITWRDWVRADELPAVVASHDICLGIFGTGPKALSVVPNKVYQGAACGCAIVTSDTPPQRRAFGDAAVLVPAGDATALAGAIKQLAEDPTELARLKAAGRAAAMERFSPRPTTRALATRLQQMVTGDEMHADGVGHA